LTVRLYMYPYFFILLNVLLPSDEYIHIFMFIYLYTYTFLIRFGLPLTRTLLCFSVLKERVAALSGASMKIGQAIYAKKGNYICVSVYI
jgi:hypothetical protein